MLFVALHPVGDQDHIAQQTDDRRCQCVFYLSCFLPRARPQSTIFTLGVSMSLRTWRLRDSRRDWRQVVSLSISESAFRCHAADKPF